MRRYLYLSIILLVFYFSGIYAKEEARLLRFPTIHKNQVVFSYAGDLYKVSANGGTARRLTSHSGYEIFPRFSHDGKKIAFTGQYDGNTEVFLIPAEGGIPKRITYTATLGRDDIADRMGPNNIVFGWKHDNNSIVFRSRNISFNSFNGKLYTVSDNGEMPQGLPVPRGGFCSFSPDDSKMAYNRIFREFRTWKRYRGGMADDVWIFDFNTKKIENITNNDAQDICPMWHKNDIYYISDKGENKRMNLYVYNTSSKQTKKITNYKDFDIKFPSLGLENIIFENGGYLYKFNLEKQKTEKLEIFIENDFLYSRNELVKTNKNITNYEISPDGKRALFGARGEIYTVPQKDGATRNLTKTSNVHERNSKWSPNGKWIAFISDKTGEDEIYIINQMGNGKPIKLTSTGETYKYSIKWSPDSKKILWADRKQRLRYVNIVTKRITEVDNSNIWEIRNYNWSPDSKWISYSKQEEESNQSIINVYSLLNKKSFKITDMWYSSNQPVFSKDGKYLFFVSSRDFNPIYSWTEWNHAYTDMSRIYLITLAKATNSPFKANSDEVEISSSSKTKEKNSKNSKESVKTVIDINGISNRIVPLPIKPSSYHSISALNNKVYYVRNGNNDEKPTFLFYDLEKKKETELGKINGYEISEDTKKILVSQNGSYAILDLPVAPIKIEEKIKTDGMESLLNRKDEWNQIFNETWRQMREFFYAPNMHGVDWVATKKKYQPLVKHVNHRNDLTYILGEMVSELNIGHAYVGGGDRVAPKRINMGLLGAKIIKDKKSGYFKIVKILDGQSWDKNLISPLRAIGVNVNEGNYILGIDGKNTKNVNNIYSLLINKANKQVVLSVNSKPNAQGIHSEIVVPISNEAGLYYLNWVKQNIEKVSKATNNKVGYIHVPDMGVRGLNEFVKYFYPQLKKKALIIDVRGNGGGNVSPMIIERLRRQITMITIARNTKPDVNPGEMIYGPMVCLANEFSASDGDIFTYRFKKHNLGKVIGKRTWGGVVGIRGPLPMVDGGQLYKPEFSRYDVEGKEWIMEGVGVEPDIMVDNDPYLEYTGTDQQLNKAIEVINEELKTKEKNIPKPPTYPKK